ncbi:MAG TPA: DUF72 domain-containing protein [Flavisolibacter sp.]|nr:DUF72 domain-containing protein [Flavisolibacter sp.]
MPLNWYIGCSGFHYKEWKTFFYPRGLSQSRWFDYYAEHFNTLELNVTFYRFPQLRLLEAWYRKAPADFMFSVKAPRLIAHYKQFKETFQLCQDFYATVGMGLKEKLGAILFQLPPQLHYADEVLDRILGNMDPQFTNVLEFRHSSWWKEPVYRKLADHGISFCGHSYPGLPDKVVINTPAAYYRFHGVPKLYYSQYDASFINAVGEALKSKDTLDTAFVYFNNTATEAALRNAAQLVTALGLPLRGAGHLVE